MNAETFYYLSGADFYWEKLTCKPGLLAMLFSHLTPETSTGNARTAPRPGDSSYMFVGSGSPSVCSAFSTTMVMLVKSLCWAVSVTVSWKT